MVVLAIFKGTNSLEYKKNTPYTLVMKKNTIQRIDGTGLCKYESIVSFLSNWEMVQVIQEEYNNSKRT